MSDVERELRPAEHDEPPELTREDLALAGWEVKLTWSWSTSGCLVGCIAAAAAVVAGLLWGWAAFGCAALAAFGVVMMISGPRPGDEVTEAWTPPPEKSGIEVAGLGFTYVQQGAGYQLTRPATLGDVARTSAMGLALLALGAAGLLAVKDMISTDAVARGVLASLALVFSAWAVALWRHAPRAAALAGGRSSTLLRQRLAALLIAAFAVALAAGAVASHGPDTLGDALKVGGTVVELAAFAWLIATSIFALATDEETAANGFVRLIGALVLAGIAYALGLLDPWLDVIRSL
jgi:hypothetical protein